MLIEWNYLWWKGRYFLGQLDLNNLVYLLTKPKSTKNKEYLVSQISFLQDAKKKKPGDLFSPQVGLPIISYNLSVSVDVIQPPSPCLSTDLERKWSGANLLASSELDQSCFLGGLFLGCQALCRDRLHLSNFWLARKAPLVAYKQQVDSAALWIPGCCTLGPRCSERTGQLYNQW